MNRLAIELSTIQRSLAFETSLGRSLTRSWLDDRTKADPLFLHLQSLREEAGADWQALDQIIVGRGPGMYSGMRAAVSAAAGLALPQDLQVIGIDSGLALARAALSAGTSSGVLVLGDARRGKWWAGLFHRSDSGVPEMRSDWSLVDGEGLAVLWPGPDCVLVSSEWDRLEDAVRAVLPGDSLIPAASTFPDAGELIALAHAIEAGDLEAAPALPIYLHPAVSPPA